jgi:NADH dehydrogenase FAD-containing subunit
MIHEYLEGSATAINVANRTVTVKLNSLLDDVVSGAEVEPPTLTLSYDHLVVSVGSRVDDRGVPGADRALRLKSTDDARRLRTAVGECFEYASRPDVSSPEAAKERSRRVTFLIVGGGPTGVELAGELHDLFEDVTRFHKGTYPKLAESVRVILAHGGPSLVPQFEEALRTEAQKSLEKKGVEVILNTRVTEVGDGYARLSTKVVDSVTGRPTEEREDSVLPVGLTVWCAGTAPVPFVEDLLSQLAPEARNYDGRVKVDRWMRPPMNDPALLGSVLVLGDAAACSGCLGSGDKELPATAQVAGQQGAYVARLLDRGYDLQTTPPVLPCMDTETQDTCDVFYDPALNAWLRFRGLDLAPPFGFLNLGMLAYLGGGEALSQVQLGDVPILAWAGSVAFVLWRSVYLVKQVATRNRILVTFDWIKSMLFGRDMTRL